MAPAVQPGKNPENLLLVFKGNADAVVFHSDTDKAGGADILGLLSGGQASLLPGGGVRDGMRTSRLEACPAFFGPQPNQRRLARLDKFQGVAHQIETALAQRRLVRQDGWPLP